MTVTGHFFDDYWLDETVVAQTNTNGQAIFNHIGPPCVGAIAFLLPMQPPRRRGRPTARWES